MCNMLDPAKVNCERPGCGHAMDRHWAEPGNTFGRCTECRCNEFVASGPLAASRIPADEDPTPVRLYPQTAREALLEIRRRLALTLETRTSQALDEIALEGLARTEPINFELTDQLADYLAKAHGVLDEVRQYLYGKLPDGDNVIEYKVLEAMSLPPDLETIVERHKR
jgi:hypothetical protein